MGKQQRSGLWALAIALLTIGAYLNSLTGGFVYDDVFFIQESPLIRDLSNAPTMFASAFWESSSQPVKAFYRPLTVLSYAANFALGGHDPLGYHLVNVALHAANAVLVFALTYLLSRNRILSGAVALLFGVHPAATEVVAWVSGRGDVLGTCFSLAALVLYVRAHPPGNRGHSRSRRIRYLHVLSVLAFLTALYTKESAVTVIGILVVYELTLRTGVPNTAFRLLPFFVVLACYLACRVVVLDGLTVTSIHFIANPLVDEPIGPRALTGVLLFGKYLALLAFPIHLAVDHSYNQIPVVRTFWDSGLLLSAGTGLLLVGIWWRSWQRDRVLFFALGLFFVAGGLIFANALFPFTAIFGERFMYFPSVGFLLALCRLCAAGLTRLGPRTRIVTGSTSAVLVLAFFSARTVSRNADWRDEFTLFRSAVAVSPNSALANFLLANQYYARGMLDPARSGYERALEVYPEYGKAWAGMGNVSLAHGRYEQALDQLSVAVRILPNHDETRVLMGVALAGLGRLDDAQKETELALRLNPKNSQTYNNLANIHLLRGDLNRAMSLWREATRLNPSNAEALYNLASNYEKLGDPTQARAFYEQFLRFAPARLAGAKTRAKERLKALENQ